MTEDREDRIARREVCALVAFHALLTGPISTLPSELVSKSIALGAQLAYAMESANETFER